MTYSSTIDDLKHEIILIDLLIEECQDECGVAHPWMKQRLSVLVEQKESFRKCINYFEVNEINVG